MILLLHSKYVLLIVIFNGLVHAQPWTNATCTNRGTTWATNSLGQSPCLVAAFLGAVCDDDNTWGVEALSASNRSYLAVRSNKCVCNSVVWSLLMACSLCQGRGSYSWALYSIICNGEDVSAPGVYPAAIPAGVAVPNWAYYNYVTIGAFNSALARQQSGPESTAPPRPSRTATSSSTTNISIGSSATSTSTDLPEIDSSRKSDTGAIVGGAVGGVLGIALFALVAFIVIHKSNQKKQEYEPPTHFDGTQASYGQYKSGTQSLSPLPATPSYKPYDPSNPSGFPVGHTNNPNGFDSVPNLYYQQNAGAGASRPNIPQF